MHEMDIRVYYEDTDFGGVVYYANYLKFIERGRTEALRGMGIDQVALKAEGRVFVVRRAEVDWLAPARFDDILTVKTRPSWVRGASAGMAQEVWHDRKCLLTAEVTIACMTADGRPARLPDSVRQGLTQALP